jgi:flagellar basal body-associated protein FliL
MKKRDKWILIVVIIGGFACGIAVVAYFGYFAVWAMRDLNKMEARRPVRSSRASESFQGTFQASRYRAA